MAIVISMDKSTRIARLLRVLWHGERIASDTAARQALMCGEVKARRFFSMQSAQESLHAALFHAAGAVLTRRTALPQSAAVASLGTYRRHLEHDLSRGHVAASIIGLQIVLEGLGALTLSGMDLTLSRHGGRFAGFKRLLEQQEDTHHAYGRSWLARQHTTYLPQLAIDAQRYFSLACVVIDSNEELFCFSTGSPQEYRSQLRAALPPALTQGWQ